MREDLALLDGAIDMHAHTAPALFPRPYDDADLAEGATAYKMRGFVLKDHDSSTTGRAYYISRMYPSVEPFGALVLNRSVGGLNPYVVESAIHYGAKVIWMPSNHSEWHAEYYDMPDYPALGRTQPQLPGEGVTVLDPDGNLKPEVLSIVELIAQHDVALATGHLHLREIRKLQDAVLKHGDVKFLVTHANWALCKLDLEVQRELIAKGAYLEYVASSCVSLDFMDQDPDELASWINEFGGDRLVFGSDLGQLGGPSHPEGLRMLLASLLARGVKYEYLEKMTKGNPATVLGLE
ncbi:MAG: DUF6282 family protein [Acidimicrobiia bacterium]